MNCSSARFLLLVFALATALIGAPSHLLYAAGTKVTINSDLVLTLDGKKVFPIGFTIPPPSDGKTSDGRNALEELASAGAMFVRSGSGRWNEETIAREKKWMDAAARAKMYCWPYLGDIASIRSNDTARAATLRKVISTFRNHPGLLVWKGADEPEWGRQPIEPLLHARDIIRDLDPNHPIVIIQAPRGTVETLRPYNVTGDIIGMDIYPLSYPPGIHSLLPNRTLSLVGDHTRIMMEVAGGKLPVWMVLQISWSGVLNPGKTLRFPTFPEERFMTYQAIINGARGLVYFGGGNRASLSPADARLGWNWTFWKKVLRPVVEEIGSKSPLYPALVAPNSTLPIKVSGAKDVEFCVREVGGELFLLACKREGATVNVEFSGLPKSAHTGEVMFESPRSVKVTEGKFTDWFAPFDVHVYRFGR